nr:rifin PIR protein,putative [Plasmodium sp. DRC-Itaito]
MKVHYINILLFAHALNILAHNKNKPSITHHKSTTRLLCECELNAPANYDSDPEMKSVMDNFNKQTQQRFHEYDERMKTTRQKCKEQCDKEIQKIILKDKLEKQMAQQLTILNPNITTENIPTCVCEKSIADKTEKFCLNCGKNMGVIAPWWGLVCGAWYAGWTNYVATTVAKAATDAGIKAGVKMGFQGLREFPYLSELIKVSEIKSLINSSNYANKTTYVNIIEQVKSTDFSGKAATIKENFCKWVSMRRGGESHLVERAEKIAEEAAGMAEYAKNQVLEAAAHTTNALTTTITASIIAIVVIVLIMLIIYLILRHRRKKKMKKKLQYIKLLEE